MVYGNFTNEIKEDADTKPINIYGEAKLAGERLVKLFCKDNKMNYAIVRPSGVYGPGDLPDRVISKFFESALKNKTLNEWWIFGNNALTENCVDDIINIQCTTKLTSQTFKINDGYYEYTYSKCPLIPSYIDKKENNQYNKDLIYFI